MAEFRTVGTGITRKRVVTYQLPDDAEEFFKPPKIGFSLVDLIERQENTCSLVLQKAGLPHQAIGYVKIKGQWTPAEGRCPSENPGIQFAKLQFIILNDLARSPDSDEGYAARILMLISCLRADLARSDASQAAYHSWQIGDLICEWAMKQRWERYLATGQRIVETGKRNRQEYNQRRSTESGMEWEPALQEARRLKTLHPNLSNSAIAGHLKKKLNLKWSEDRIRRKLGGRA